MTLTLSPPMSRAAALGILVVLLATLYLGIAQPLIDDYVGTQESIAQSLAALERYRRVAAELPAREAMIAALKQRASAQDGFLQGTNEALVAAQIQNRVKALVEEAHGELKSTQILPMQEEGKLRRVAVRSQMSLTLGAARHVIYGLEANYPLVFLDGVDIRVRGQRRRDLPPNEDPILDVRFDVYGYMRDKG